MKTRATILILALLAGGACDAPDVPTAVPVAADGAQGSGLAQSFAQPILVRGYVTQGVQRMNARRVPLTAGKRGVLRVFILSHDVPVPRTVVAEIGDEELQLELWAAQRWYGPDAQEADWSRLAQHGIESVMLHGRTFYAPLEGMPGTSWNAEVPGELIAGDTLHVGLRLAFDDTVSAHFHSLARPDSLRVRGDTIENRLAFEVVDVPPVRVTLVPLRTGVDSIDADVDSLAAELAEADTDGPFVARWAQLFPPTEWEIEVGEPIESTTSGGAIYELGLRTWAGEYGQSLPIMLVNWNGKHLTGNHIYSVLDETTRDPIATSAYVECQPPGPPPLADTVRCFFNPERPVGRMLGLKHVPVGALMDAGARTYDWEWAYPYESASIGVWGWRLDRYGPMSPRLASGQGGPGLAHAVDFMSFANGHRWVSDVHYEKLLARLTRPPPEAAADGAGSGGVPVVQIVPHTRPGPGGWEGSR